MNNNEFMALARRIEQYLNENKLFIENTNRFNEFAHATAVAHDLFKDMHVYIKHDSLELGSMVLCVEGFDIIIRGQHEMHQFNEIVSKSDNFEIYPSKESIKLSIMFNNVFKRI